MTANTTSPEHHSRQEGRSIPELPRPITPLIGRERYAAMACELLRRPNLRLVTLPGPGGIGKTRLALKVARDLAGEFSGGVWFVLLAGVPDPERGPMPSCTPWGSKRSVGERERTRWWRPSARRRRCSCWTTSSTMMAAALLTDLLMACPHITVLVTSRSLLRISGEHALQVPPLVLLDTVGARSLEEVAEALAVRLFVERPNAIAPSFALTAATAPLVAENCRLLDGLPLVIELAAARVNNLPLPTLRDWLDRRLSVLSSGTRDAPQRHQTMREAVAWSYGLLIENEQAIFRRLAVFAGIPGLVLLGRHDFRQRPSDTPY